MADSEYKLMKRGMATKAKASFGRACYADGGQAEIKNTPRNKYLGAAADTLKSAREALNHVPLPETFFGGGLGEFAIGPAADEVNEWSYGNSPFKENPPYSQFIPEIKPERAGGLMATVGLPVAETAAIAKLGMRGATAATKAMMGVGENVGRREFAKKAAALTGGAAVTAATPPAIRGVAKALKLGEALEPKVAASTAAKVAARVASPHEFYAAVRAREWQHAKQFRDAGEYWNNRMRPIQKEELDAWRQTPEGRQFEADMDAGKVPDYVNIEDYAPMPRTEELAAERAAHLDELMYSRREDMMALRDANPAFKDYKTPHELSEMFFDDRAAWEAYHKKIGSFVGDHFSFEDAYKAGKVKLPHVDPISGIEAHWNPHKQTIEYFSPRTGSTGRYSHWVNDGPGDGTVYKYKPEKSYSQRQRERPPEPPRSNGPFDEDFADGGRVKKTKRKKYADGSEAIPREDESRADDMNRGRIRDILKSVSIPFGSVPTQPPLSMEVNPLATTSANPSPALRQGGMASRPWSALQRVDDVTKLAGTPGALPRGATFGNVALPAKGGTVNTISAPTAPLPQTVAPAPASPTPSIPAARTAFPDMTGIPTQDMGPMRKRLNPLAASLLNNPIQTITGMADGGPVKKPKKMAFGMIKGPGTTVSDSIPVDLASGAKIMGSDREYVMPADSVEAAGGEEALDAFVAATHVPAAIQKKFGQPRVAAADGLPGDKADSIYRTIREAREAMERQQMRATAKARRTPIVRTIQQAQAQQPVQAPPEVPNTARPTGPIEPRFVRNPDGSMSPREAQFREAQIRSAGDKILSEATDAGKIPPDEKVGRVAKAQEAVKGGARGLLGGYLAGQSIAGSAEKIREDLVHPERRDAMQAQLGVTGPWGSAAADTADALARTGNAVTFGFAGKVGERLSNWFADRGFVPDSDFKPASGATTTPATSPAAPITKVSGLKEMQDAELPKLGVPAAQAAQAPITSNILPGYDEVGQRRAFINNTLPEADAIDRSKYNNLGDYGAPGTKIFGRSTLGPNGKINDFAGVGGGKPVPDSGVDFGIPRMTKAGVFSSANDLQAPTPPQYQVSPEVASLRKQIAEQASQVASFKPGEYGRKTAMRKLESMRGALASLQAADINANNYAATVFGYANSAYQTATNRRIAQETAAGKLASDTARLKFDYAQAATKAHDDMIALQRTRGKEFAESIGKGIEGLSKLAFPGNEEAQKGYNGLAQALLMTKQFDTPEGPKFVKDMNPAEANNILGQLDAVIMQSVADYLAGEGVDLNAPPGTERATLWTILSNPGRASNFWKYINGTGMMQTAAGHPYRPTATTGYPPSQGQ